MSPVPEVVVTGIGVISPIGVGKEEVWNSLKARRSGISQIPSIQGTPFPVTFGAPIVEGFDPKRWITPRKALKVMSAEIQAGVAAGNMALEDSALDTSAIDHERFGVVYGSEMFYCQIHDVREVYTNSRVNGEFQYGLYAERAMSDIEPLFMLKYLPNMPACHVGIAHSAFGPNNTLVQGEASSLYALSEAAGVIERGHADIMIVGGAGTRLNITPRLQRGDLYLSHRNSNPAEASRPFDLAREGMVNGEGAAALVLETAEHARARGARILARVAGCGSSFGPVEDGPRHTRAIATAIERALAKAELTPADVGHVNAHGLSTQTDDALEAAAIRQVLGDTPVTAPKSFFGNLGAGGGLVEAVISLLALEHEEVPVTLNYETPDPACPVNVVHGEPLKGRPRSALALNQSTTGQSAAAVFLRD